MNTEQVNKIMADACGVTEFKYDRVNCDGDGLTLTFTGYKTKSFKVFDVWTIEDARCREIIREKFGIGTQQDSGLGNWFAHYNVYEEGVKIFKYYKTIAEAEIACIIAICEQLEP